MTVLGRSLTDLERLLFRPSSQVSSAGMSEDHSGSLGEQTKQNQTDLHVVTENGEQCFMWRSNQLSYIAQDRQELPVVLANKFGPIATKLDLSYNSLTSFKNINSFSNLTELILDNNSLEDDHLDFEQNLRLKTLSLNKNKLIDLYRLVNSIKKCFPNLEYLSLIGNPLCPTLVAVDSDRAAGYHLSAGERSKKDSCSNTSVVVDGRHLFDLCNGLDLSCGLALDGKQEAEFNHLKYRYFIIYHLPNLRFLDSTQISGSERDEALRRFYWMDSSAQMSFSPDQNQQTKRSNNNGNNQIESENNSRFSSDVANLSLLDGQEEAQTQLTIITNNLNENVSQTSSRGAFSRLSHRYTGKNSEGNRFIRNHDL